MGKYDENISDNSLWITSTPTPLTQTLPFYITEAGHFMAGSGYGIKRDMHDSFLLLYTVSGQGVLKTGEHAMPLSRGYSIMIDCHIPHEYHTASEPWEFLWIHCKGIGMESLFNMIYPDAIVNAIKMQRPYEFENRISELINKANKNDVASRMDISAGIHLILNLIYSSALATVSRKKALNSDVQTAIAFIENNYSSFVTVDDMIKDIHISKYHFIRSFHRVMGITPYQYLINYRITVSKTLLRTTTKTISEIAEVCGFLDTSNFITQFKKHTGQKPLQYRRDFS